MPDADVQDYVRQALGTGATGFASDDVTCVVKGGGSNGKTTIVNGVARALGPYARVVPAAMLGGAQEHASDGLELLGTRLAFLEETGPNQRLDTNKLKRLVGTPRIKARPNYKAWTEFTATHTLVLTTNNTPTVTDTDHGTWRRLVLVPFDVTFWQPTEATADGPVVDPGIRDRVLGQPAVQQAVLAWVVSGAQDWFANDKRLPTVPRPVAEATRAWREDGDLLFGFLPRYLVSDPTGFVEVLELLGAFNEHLPNGQYPWGQSTFRTRVGDHPAMKEMGGTWWRNSRTRRSGFKGVSLLNP